MHIHIGLMYVTVNKCDILQHTDCLNPPEGGSLTYSSDFTNVATYQCNDELQLTQLELSRACTATGWDKEDLSCSK